MMDDRTSWFSVTNIHDIDSPSFLIYRDRVIQNIQLAIQMTGNADRLRPHAKTHKCKEVIELMMSAGILKFKCATIAEAEMIALCGAADILLAYQPVGPKIIRFIQLIKNYPLVTFSCLVDDLQVAKDLSAVATAHAVSVRCFLDVNVGMNRTGIAVENVQRFYQSCISLNHLKIVGLHAYEGHISDTDITLRTEHANHVLMQVYKLKEELYQSGLNDVVLVVGGSPTFSIFAKHDDIECSPGTFVFWDWSYQESFPDLQFIPAALVISRVVSVNKHLVCLDLGHKSKAAENPLHLRVKFLNAPPLKFISHSEEHLVVETGEANALAVGKLLYGLPRHVCPTCALYAEAYIVEDRTAVSQWKIVGRERRIHI